MSVTFERAIREGKNVSQAILPPNTFSAHVPRGTIESEYFVARPDSSGGSGALLARPFAGILNSDLQQFPGKVALDSDPDPPHRFLFARKLRGGP
jgi:hypothetical protein